MTAFGPPAKRPPHIGFFASSAWSGTVGLALLCALLLAPVTTRPADEDKVKLGEFIPAAPPQPAPEVGFTDLDGKPASLGDFVGKPTVVNLWATWCEPCLKEMPSLEQLQSDLDGKLAVAAVSEDRGGAKVVGPFVAEKGFDKLKIYLDPKSELGHAIKIRGLPTSIVLDAEGRIVGKVEGGADWQSEKIQAVLRPLLAKPSDTLKKAAR